MQTGEEHKILCVRMLGTASAPQRSQSSIDDGFRPSALRCLRAAEYFLRRARTNELSRGLPCKRAQNVLQPVRGGLAPVQRAEQGLALQASTECTSAGPRWPCSSPLVSHLLSPSNLELELVNAAKETRPQIRWPKNVCGSRDASTTARPPLYPVPAASMAYLVHAELLRSFTCDAGVAAAFTGPEARNLITFRASGIDIYTVFTLPGGSGSNATAGGAVKLILESSHRLAGVVKDVAAVRFPGCTKDSLLVSFSDAKCSFLDWNADKLELTTISLHFFETDDLKRGYTRFHLPPLLTVDPAMRCAAMIVLDRHIAVLPFNDGGDALSALYGWGVSRTNKTQDSWVLDCAQMGINQLLGAKFLHEYFQPTLLILYEAKPTWSGRAMVTWNTRSVMAVSLDIARKAWSVIWKIDGLSNDVQSLWTVPGPVGGAVLLGANIIYYVNQATRFCMAVNIHGTVNPPAVGKLSYWRSDEGLVMDAARLVVVDATARYASCLLSDKHGVIYVLNVMVGDSAFELAPIGASSIAAALSVVPGGFVFLASRLGDSLLLRCTATNPGHAAGGAIDPRARKRAKTALVAAVDASKGGNDAEDALYNELFAGDDPAAKAREREDEVVLWWWWKWRW
jgi:hypothetical protein